MNLNIQERVALKEKKYRSTIESLVDTIWVIDTKDMTFLYISPESFETRGFSQKELIGQSVRNIMTEESYKKIEAMYEDAKKELQQGVMKAHKTEIQVIRKNHSRVWVEVSTKFVKDDDGSIKIVGISKDISERKKAEFEKEELLNELQDTLIEKKRLLKQIKQLESLLPICSSCRRIRDNENKKWWPFEKYIEEKSHSKFSHTICPDCQEILYSKD